MYDTIDGTLLDPRFKSTIEIMPQEVREMSPLSSRYSYFSLSPNTMQEFFGSRLLTMGNNYCSDYSSFYSTGGKDMIVRGEDSSLDYFVSAVINEIILRYGKQTDVSASWVNSGGIYYLMDLRDAGRWDEYNGLRNSYLSSQILLMMGIDTLEDSRARWLVSTVQQHRFANMLPTIWRIAKAPQEIIKLYGRQFVSTIWRNSEKYLFEPD